jgi:parallel beta-helix repeat protein
MTSKQSSRGRGLAIAWTMFGCLTLSLTLLGCSKSPSSPGESSDLSDPLAPAIYPVLISDRVQYDLQERLINAVPGDVIELEEGVYRLHSQLDLTCDNITIRGRGSDKTILSFQGQQTGSEGLVATGNALVIEKLAVEDTVGNAIKVLGADGVIFRDVRTEWTGGPSPDNGAYGIYPVQCSNVLIEDCVAIGASDAGIYVGQSHDVIVRRCRAEQNVAGIEIENTHRADVYENVATNNTGGLLVFDLPGLQVTNGGRVRVFNNRIFKNNLPNFAPPGNIVASVPAGTGVMIMALDDVQIFDNEIADNQTTGIGIFSYLITGRPIQDANYDPFAEGTWIYNNKISGGGDKPSGRLATMLAEVVGTPFPQIFFDGIVNEKKLVDGKLPDKLLLKLSNNGQATFANGNVGLLSPENVASGLHTVDRDLTNYSGAHTPLETVKLAELPAPPAEGNPAVEVYRRAPLRLSGWGLFEGDGSSQQPVAGVFSYQLNTPLFSDHTSKYRFIRLPDGKAMTYQPDSVFDFPVGTIIAKTFSYPVNANDPEAGEQLLETRIQQHTRTGWYGFSYSWNDEQTDALLTLGGAALDVSWIQSDGSRQSNRYQIPNANQCVTCHELNGKFVPLGPTAANLNREIDGGQGNQLAHFQQAGLLSDTPELTEIPALAVYDDPSTGTVGDRARAWLDVNCAHCHNPGGSARTSGLDLRAGQIDPAKYGVWKSPVATGRASGGHKFDIVPGKPEESILMYRLHSDEPGVRMPNLARNMSHPESIALVHAWIKSLPAQAPLPGQ